MQFIANGPDIPDSLIQAHEEGRVVFFCGAGISYSADLPGLKKLVEKIYDLIGTTLNENELEKKAFQDGEFDRTLNLLEQRIPKRTMRNALFQSLQPNLSREGATKTHQGKSVNVHFLPNALNPATNTLSI
ncbi:hypothetical protein PSI19_20195 [Xenorhabdus khoisanae]|uniref:hypothetical protein n=1 Tax=Xenorhabdus khoisanae TaxID=880157 RepID=UPI002359549A|nr:hypothetical protein [Xenorhabdus khoisanae]MDC9616132.1 hypothetical protein [Xenorhabdus khoisanae]